MKLPSIFRYWKGRCLRYWKAPKPAPKSSRATAQPSARMPAQKARARGMWEIEAVSVTSIISRAGSTPWWARLRSITSSMDGSLTDSAERFTAMLAAPSVGSGGPPRMESSASTLSSTIRSICPISPWRSAAGRKRAGATSAPSGLSARRTSAS